jgi:ABC-type uncharacterized transport system auxiliary subunit
MKKLTITLTIFMILSACSSGSKKQVERLYYRFSQPEQVELNFNLEIKRPTSLGILGNRPMVAMNDQGALRQMNSNFWLESPKVLLQNYLSKKFFSKQEAETEKVILESEIRRFEKSKSKAFVTIHFRATNTKGEELLNKTYEQTMVSQENSVQSFANRIKEAIEIITDQLYKDLNL